MRSALTLVAVLVSWTVFATPALANIETPDGAVISPETPLARAIVRYLETTAVRDLRVAPQFRIGLTPRFELGVGLPFVVSRKVTRPAGDRTLSGLADLRATLKYSLRQTDAVMASTRWAILGEVVAPTGKDDASLDGVRLPRRLQLGTGGWALGLGGIHTLVRDRHRASVFLGGLYSTRHDGFRPGPEAHLRLAYWYRIAPARFDPDTRAVEIRGVLELLAEYRFESRRGSAGAGDEGAVVWFAPGVQVYASPTVQIEFNVSVPVADTIDDATGTRRWAAALAVKIRF